MTDTAPPPSGKPRLKINKYWIIGGGVAAAAVYYLYAKRSSATATATTASTDAIDPSTGIPYSEENGLDYTPVGSPYSGITSSAPYGGSLSSVTTATSNNAYAQNLNDYLVNVLGYSQTLVSSAFGKWLSGSGATLTSQESNVVQAAIAYGGQPPVGVATPNYTSNDGQSGTATSDPLSLASSYLPGSGYVKYNNGVGGYYAVTSSGQTVNLTPDQQLALNSQQFFDSNTPTYGAPSK